MDAKTQFGKESLTWVYKNSMPSMASQSGGRGKENAIFTYSPFKKLKSIKWKSGRGTIETTFEYSDYEASVMNPICLVKDEKLSSKMAWDVYNVEANKNQALVRVNNLQEKKIYEINGDSRDLISSYLLTFKPFANMKGGSKNMLSHVSYEGLSESYQESYDYTGDLKISKVVKSDMVVEYEYNGLGNIAKVIITPAIGDKSEILFYYTNIEEERQRIAEEKAKAEAERIAREEEERRLKEEEEAAAKAAEVRKLKMEKQGVLGQINVIESKKKALVEIRQGVEGRCQELYDQMLKDKASEESRIRNKSYSTVELGSDERPTEQAMQRRENQVI
jgi:hypothetical protein